MKKLICIMTIGVLMLTGCVGAKEPITTTEFKRTMESNGLTVTDKTESAEDNSYQEIYVALDEDKYSFEYYFMKNPDSANKVYDYAKDNLIKAYSEDSKAKVHDDGLNYSVSASDYYCEVVQRENTVLFVTAYPEYKDKAVDLIGELGF